MGRGLSRAKSISIALLGLGFGLGALFQNCSRLSLEKADVPVVIQSMPSLDLKSHVCSEARFSNGQPGKFVFIMDLSASNFGGWTTQTLGGQTLYYWDPELATDPSGARFDAVNYFLENCGQQPGDQFAFIGFSRSAGVLQNGSLSCTGVAFGSREQIKSKIDALRARQALDEQWYRRWIRPNYLTEAQPDSLVYSVTSYTSASKCLENLVIDDLTTNTANVADSYHIFFISDGIPEDKRGTGCNLASLTEQEKTSCYLRENLSAISMTRTAAISKGKDLRIQGIYYGSDGLVPTVLNALSQEGGTSEVVKLQGFAERQSALCDLTVSKNGIGYQPDIYMAINMTARRESGRLVADSDMDGLSDEKERLLGYDPQNPRSSGVDGVLDGICEKLGGTEACQSKRALTNCDPNLFDGLGLTDCDLKVLGLNALPGVITAGTDSDRDGIPDFVEVVKGTDPGKPDLTLDPDEDGLTTREEILRGSDPFAADRDTLEALLNHHSVSFTPPTSSPACPQGDWTLTVDRLQAARTLEFQDLPVRDNDNRHLKGEQVLLILYRLTPTNSLNPEIEYYGRYVTALLQEAGTAETLRTNPARLLPQDFKLLGKARP